MDMPSLYTHDSDEDTGYGENDLSDIQGRHGSRENVSGNHNSEAGTNKTTSRTALPNTMEQPGLQPRLSQEGCEDDWRCLEERQPGTLQNINKEVNQLQRGSDKRTEETNRQTNNCSPFLRDNCGHGLSGKIPFEGKEECDFDHPPLCWRFLKNGHGVGGCKSMKNCRRKHPRICAMSWAARKCIKINTKEKCTDGYHLKDTVVYILDKSRDIQEEQTEVPVTQGTNKGGERNLTHKVTAQEEGASTSEPQRTPEEQTEVQVTQDANKGKERSITHEVTAQGDEVSTAEPQKINPQGYQWVPSKPTGASRI